MTFLDGVGRGYTIDHCVAAFKRRRQEETFKSYVTDCLKMIAENTAKFAGGKYMTTRFSDIVTNAKPKEVRTAEEIKSSIMAGINALKKDAGGGEFD